MAACANNLSAVTNVSAGTSSAASQEFNVKAQANYAYQEFWSFRRTKERWLLELRQPSTDLDNVLEAKNVLAQIDLEEFAKDAKPEYLQEVVAR